MRASADTSGMLAAWKPCRSTQARAEATISRRRISSRCGRFARQRACRGIGSEVEEPERCRSPRDRGRIQAGVDDARAACEQALAAVVLRERKPPVAHHALGLMRWRCAIRARWTARWTMPRAACSASAISTGSRRMRSSWIRPRLQADVLQLGPDCFEVEPLTADSPWPERPSR